MSRSLKVMGREWAWLAIKHQTEPTTTGNLEHDRECAQEFLHRTGNPPSWYTKERFGPIYNETGIYPREWQPKTPPAPPAHGEE